LLKVLRPTGSVEPVGRSIKRWPLADCRIIPKRGIFSIKMKEFVHLHIHTAYSLLDGSIKIKELVDKASALNMPAAAITDHGAMYGAIEFYKTALEKGVKPIIGCEVYVAPRSRWQKEPHKDDFQYHLVLLAQNQKGYENLMELSSIGYLEGCYYKPRVDKEALAAYSEGLIALSACLAGEIPALVVKGRYEEAEKAALQYKEIFGERFYLELQDHGIKEQKAVNRALLELSRKHGIPVVATNDVHYLERRDAETQDILLCIQTGKSINDSNRLKFEGSEFYLKSFEEMQMLFPSEALMNTLEIAEMIDLKLELNQMRIPSFKVPKEYGTAAAYLKHLCHHGLQKRYGSVPTEAKTRLEYELKIIEQMGYSDYFLIVWDVVRFAKSNGIRVGPGRGSAAGSLAAYSLFITDIDPLRYGLLFERFLNPDRVSMPDIDIDFCYEKRNQVIDYVINKYGVGCVAQIITFGTMAARMAVRDAGRVLGFTYKEVDTVAKMIPQNADIKTALEVSADLKKLYDTDERYRRLIDISAAIEGLPRHTSTHAAGIVISADRLTKYSPLQKTEGVLTTQYEMSALESLGLLKMDFLGLKTLTVIDEVVEKTKGAVCLDSIPLDDSKTFDLLSRGDTIGVFQLESAGMQAVLKELKPSRFEDIIAVVALYRPGPMEQIPKFIKSKHGEEPAAYPHPDLEDILRETYGIIVYQEQIISLASRIAGFSLSQADILRRAIGKKKKEELERQKLAFIEGAARQGYNCQIGEILFNLIEKFADYGFNKSHAAAYALIAYQTAYLKANYPVEFMASLFTNAASDRDSVILYAADCQKKGIKMLPPDVNESDIGFTVAGRNAIRFGLAAVKNVGRRAAENIISTREKGKFADLYDFCARVNLSACNRRAVESLIKSGAFDSLGMTRAGCLACLDQAILLARRNQKELENDQMSLISVCPHHTDAVLAPSLKIQELPRWNKLSLEKEMLGFYVTGHPLEEAEGVLKNFAGLRKIAEIAEADEGEKIMAAGIITSLRRIYTRKKLPMAFLKAEDLSGEIEAVVFPDLYEASHHLLQEDKALILEGAVKKEGETLKLICSGLAELPVHGKAVVVEIETEHADDLKMRRLRNFLLSNRGNIPVYLYFSSMRKTILTGTSFWIRDDSSVAEAAAALVGRARFIRFNSPMERAGDNFRQA